jgi:fluoroquinolone resistance protein
MVVFLFIIVIFGYDYGMAKSINDHSEYEGEVFKDLNYTGQRIEGVAFYGCSFAKCAFQETVFSACKFNQCIFEACDLSMMKVKGCTFVETKFEGSKVMGVNWMEAAWDTAGFLRALSFEDCTINFSTFFGLHLKEIVIKDCTALEADFSEADMTKADCRNTDFAKSRFKQTDLTRADFVGAKNYTIDARINTLKKTKFSLPEAESLLHSLDIVLVE